MDRTELANFLRSRRERVRPADLGLAPGARRRTPGLRREEVAQLAGMSVDYYIRLEQARGPRPSSQILDALARALRLTDDERKYLYCLADDKPDPPTGPPQQVPQSILMMLDRLDDTPAYVIDAKYDLLAWNTMATLLIGDFSLIPKRERNFVRWFFDHDDADLTTDDLAFARELVANLRAAAARYDNDPQTAALVSDMLAASPLFVRLWEARDVDAARSTRRLLTHPVVGDLDLHCDVLLVPDQDQQIVLYTAAPGTPSYDSLRLLRVIGSQDLASPVPGPG